jgi:hypothetical protein
VTQENPQAPARPEPLLPRGGGKFYQQPYRSRMWVAPGPGGFCMMFLTERPNWWYRLWQRLFFGFIWEDISEQNTTRR